MAQLTNKQKRFLDQKKAIERLIQGEDGELFLQYLASICLMDLGCPCKDGLEYAYHEGKRSVFLAILQVSEKPISEFIKNMVIFDERG